MKRDMKKAGGLVILGMVLGMASAACGAANDIKFGEEKFEFTVGASLQNFDTNAKVENADTGIGVGIDLEDTLGYEADDISIYLNATWRFFPKHRISVSYLDSLRSVTAIALEDIDLGQGDIISAGAGYSSSFTVRVVPIEYLYSFIKNDHQELYGKIGLHWHSIDYEVLVSAGAGDVVLEADIDVKANAPMPLIGGGWDYYINDRWKLTLAAQGFFVKLSGDTLNFQGLILNAAAATEYYIWNNVGIGANLSYFKLDVDIDSDDWAGSLDYSYWGPAAYVKVRF